MVKIIEPRREYVLRDLKYKRWGSDPIVAEVNALGVAGLEISYKRNLSYEPREDTHPTIGELKENTGEIVCKGDRYKDGSIGTGPYFRLTDSGVVQEWEILVVDTYLPRRGPNEKGTYTSYTSDRGSPYFHSLVRLLEEFDTSGTDKTNKATFHLECAHRIQRKIIPHYDASHGINGLYLVGHSVIPPNTHLIEEAQHHELLIGEFTGRNNFLKKASELNDNLFFLRPNFNRYSWREDSFVERDQSDNYPERENLQAYYWMGNFPFLGEWQKPDCQESILRGATILGEIHEKYQSIIDRQNRVVDEVNQSLDEKLK